MRAIASQVYRMVLRLTGGRPMIYEGRAFTDAVSHGPVYYWRDRRDGTRWMAESRWSSFRVKATQQNDKLTGADASGSATC